MNPRYIDTHIHGAFGFDTSDADVNGLVNMARLLPGLGVKAFCPTTMTLPEDQIYRVFESVAKAIDILKDSGELYSDILGIHLEGPFLNPEMAGVQDCLSCVEPKNAFRIIENLESNFPGLLKIVDVAPELNGAIDFIKCYKDKYCISLAHTKADYDTACLAFEAGAKSVTHLMNAMNPCLKRDPGILGALIDYPDVYAEVICDGIHISPAYLRLLFKVIRDDRIVVVSDSMRGSGMPDGLYKLANVDVIVKDGRTYYGPNGGLAGSVTYMNQEASRLLEYGISENQVHLSCLINPLSRLNIML
ncbi:MAG: amidohydrolase family protein [Saccharofermentans sp.]|nr:amidohydrolase family protein [Saccharofermentans sp.]